ncbi:MAG TPA: PilZ domain-containing protein [Candidatus Acidoferrum sp.]|nr:PilZ domain-containing protein [Candidatus Acidoferrum sp.]
MAIYGKRRSERVLLDVPVFIEGQEEGAREFKEETFTLTVSAHGALVVLAAKVALGQTLRLTNLKSKDQHDAMVAFLGPPYAGLATVGIQFSKPAPEFWAIASPPADWKTA